MTDDDARVAAACRDWSRQLAADPPEIDQVIAWQRDNFLYTTGPLCRVLRPSFVTPAQLDSDRRAAETVTAALLRAGDRIAADRALRERYIGRYWADNAALLEANYGAVPRHVLARLDGYRTADGLRFLELNTAPGGFSLADRATRMFEALSAFAPFARRWQLERMLIEKAKYDAIIAAYQQWGGRGLPTIAALLPATLARLPGYQMGARQIRAYGAAHGLQIDIVDPARLRFEDGRLRHGDVVIDLVLRGLAVFSEATLRPMLAALEARAVCVVDRASIYGNKTLFAAVTDPACELGLSIAEQQAVRAHLPWTRLALPSTTTCPRGAVIDLLPWALSQREELVLKPDADCGGRGVVLGWECDSAAWADAIDKAQRDDRRHVLQARLRPLISTWPLLDRGLPEVALVADQSPFLVMERMVGYFTRLSRSAITNLTQGGSLAPTFVLRGTG
jgi:hypothetical protein